MKSVPEPFPFILCLNFVLADYPNPKALRATGLVRSPRVGMSNYKAIYLFLGVVVVLGYASVLCSESWISAAVPSVSLRRFLGLRRMA